MLFKTGEMGIVVLFNGHTQARMTGSVQARQSFQGGRSLVYCNVTFFQETEEGRKYGASIFKLHPSQPGSYLQGLNCTGLRSDITDRSDRVATGSDYQLGGHTSQGRSMNYAHGGQGEYGAEADMVMFKMTSRQALHHVGKTSGWGDVWERGGGSGTRSHMPVA